MINNNIPRKGQKGKDFTDLKNEIDQNLSVKVQNIEAKLTADETKISNLEKNTLSFYTVSSSVPTNTTKLWVDTSTGAAILKYYDTSTSTWKAINQTYS